MTPEYAIAYAAMEKVRDAHGFTLMPIHIIVEQLGDVPFDGPKYLRLDVDDEMGHSAAQRIQPNATYLQLWEAADTAYAQLREKNPKANVLSGIKFIDGFALEHDTVVVRTKDSEGA